MRLAFFTQSNYCEIHPSDCVYHWFLFLLLSDTEWHKYVTVYLFIHLSKDLWDIPSFWLLQIKLLRTFMYRTLCELVFTPCGKCPKVQLHFYSTRRPPLSCLATQMDLSDENPEPSAFKGNGLLAGHPPRRQRRGGFSVFIFPSSHHQSGFHPGNFVSNINHAKSNDKIWSRDKDR